MSRWHLMFLFFYLIGAPAFVSQCNLIPHEQYIHRAIVVGQNPCQTYGVRKGWVFVGAIAPDVPLCRYPAETWRFWTR